MRYYSVTCSHKYEGAVDYHPRTAVFSTLDAAIRFTERLTQMHDERDQDYLVFTLDSGYVDDAQTYIDVYDEEMRDDETDQA